MKGHEDIYFLLIEQVDGHERINNIPENLMRIFSIISLTSNNYKPLYNDKTYMYIYLFVTFFGGGGGCYVLHEVRIHYYTKQKSELFFVMKNR